ncbi:MAG: hypothetical protein KGJ07_06250 [Patescibacteria group bacterium]|nr:hypothetical protein [Patescibacteria group bacterium]MDE2588143.1 hypothetical protein [Patescibacteria group bacterium]
MRQKGFSALTVLGVMGLLVIVMVVGIVMMSVKKTAPTAATTQSTTQDTQGKFVEHTLDLSGGVPDSQKTVVEIEQSDSSMEKVILPTSSVAVYIKGLPQGARLISQSPYSSAK